MLTDWVLGHYQRLQLHLEPWMDIILLAVGSEGEQSRSICEMRGFKYLDKPNNPLNYKWNAGMARTKDYSPDGVVIVGSDDLLNAGYFHALASWVTGRETGVVFGLHDLYVMHLETMRIGYWSGGDNTQRHVAIGLGRFFPRLVLDRVHWTPWSSEVPRNWGLDASCARKLTALGIGFETHDMDELGAVALDVKGGENLWGWERMDCIELLGVDRRDRLLSELELDLPGLHRLRDACGEHG